MALKDARLGLRDLSQLGRVLDAHGRTAPRHDATCDDIDLRSLIAHGIGVGGFPSQACSFALMIASAATATARIPINLVTIQGRFLTAACLPTDATRSSAGPTRRTVRDESLEPKLPCCQLHALPTAEPLPFISVASHLSEPGHVPLHVEPVGQTPVAVCAQTTPHTVICALLLFGSVTVSKHSA